MKYLILFLLSFNTFGDSLSKYVPKKTKSIQFKLSDTQFSSFEGNFKTQSVSLINDYKDFIYGIELENATNSESEIQIERYNFLIGYEKKDKFFSYPYAILSLGKNSYEFNDLKGNGFSNGLDIGMSLKKFYPLELFGGFKFTNDYYHEYGNSNSYDLYLKFSFKFK